MFVRIVRKTKTKKTIVTDPSHWHIKIICEAVLSSFFLDFFQFFQFHTFLLTFEIRLLPIFFEKSRRFPVANKSSSSIAVLGNASQIRSPQHLHTNNQSTFKAKSPGTNLSINLIPFSSEKSICFFLSFFWNKGRKKKLYVDPNHPANTPRKKN